MHKPRNNYLQYGKAQNIGMVLEKAMTRPKKSWNSLNICKLQCNYMYMYLVGGMEFVSKYFGIHVAVRKIQAVPIVRPNIDIFPYDINYSKCVWKDAKCRADVSPGANR